jgi:hypothetical protein
MDRDEQLKPTSGRTKALDKSETRDPWSAIDVWLEVVALALMCGFLVLLGYVLW